MQERAKKTRRKILEAGIQEFSAHGFYGGRIDRIARLARVNKQRIYAYYGNKDGLYRAVLRRSFEDLARFEETFFDLQEKDIPYLGEILLKHYVMFHGRSPHFWRLLAWENLEGGLHSDVLEGIRESSYGHIRRLYEKGQAQGIYEKGVSFETFIFVLTSIAFFCFSNRLTLLRSSHIDLQDPETIQRLLRESLELMRLPHLGPQWEKPSCFRG